MVSAGKRFSKRKILLQTRITWELYGQHFSILALYGGADTPDPPDAQYPLIVDIHALVVVEPPVAFIYPSFPRSASRACQPDACSPRACDSLFQKTTWISGSGHME